MHRAFFVITVAALAASCGRTSPDPEQRAEPAVSAPLASVVRASFPDTYEAGGVIRARTTATITSRIMAPVADVLVKAGDRVRAGQVLARLDARELGAAARRAASGRAAAEQARRAAAAERDAARAALTLATATHRRITLLHDRRSATDGEMDEAAAQVRGADARAAAADARVAEADAALAEASAGAEAAGISAGWATLAAPFTGTVTESLIERGNMAAPGTPLFRLEQDGGLRLEVRVDESRAAAIRIGQEVPVILDAAPPTPIASGDAASIRGRVVEIARAADAGAHAFLIKIDLPGGAVPVSGTYARARLPGADRDAVTVPRGAVQRTGQLTSVYVADGDRMRLRLVSLGQEQDGRVEVLAGLDPGERVVAAISPSLADGRRIAEGPR